MLSIFFALSPAAFAAPPQDEGTAKKPKKLTVYEKGQIALEFTEKGRIRYVYEDSRLKEVHGPGTQVTIYHYKDEKLFKVLHLDKVLNGATQSPEQLDSVALSQVQSRLPIEEAEGDALMAEGGGEACQIDSDGNTVICSD